METIKNTLKKYNPKIYIAGLVVFLLIVVFYLYKTGFLQKYVPFLNKTEKAGSGGKKGKSKVKGKKRGDGESNSKSLKELFKGKKTEEEEEDEEKENLQSDAKKLYDLIHEDLAKGSLTSEQFKSRVGDLADDAAYIELKQLYSSYRDTQKNPNDVPVSSYEGILSKN